MSYQKKCTTDHMSRRTFLQVCAAAVADPPTFLGQSIVYMDENACQQLMRLIPPTDSRALLFHGMHHDLTRPEELLCAMQGYLASSKTREKTALDLKISSMALSYSIRLSAVMSQEEGPAGGRLAAWHINSTEYGPWCRLFRQDSQRGIEQCLEILGGPITLYSRANQMGDWRYAQFIGGPKSTGFAYGGPLDVEAEKALWSDKIRQYITQHTIEIVDFGTELT